MTKGERILALENELTIALTRLAQAEVRISLLEQGQRTSPYLAGESASILCRCNEGCPGIQRKLPTPTKTTHLSSME